MSIAIDDRTEWLETDGLGGFASGTTSGIRTRRYHGLLLAAATPPTSRFMLVNGVEATLRTPEGDFPLASQRYTPDVTTGSSGVRLESFTADPWPRWSLSLEDGTRIAHELCATKGAPRTVLTWRLLTPQRGVRLLVRPLLSGRDYHALHHENPSFRFDPQMMNAAVRWTPYAGVPSITARHNGLYRHEPVWYRRFQYDQDRERGTDFVEDLASPGTFEFDLSAGTAELVLAADAASVAQQMACSNDQAASELCDAERARRARFRSPLDRAADHYLVQRGTGTTIIAGYPWFGDWGRDTFIALRGLCLANGRIDDARRILLAWADCDSRGVLPNRFADDGGTPEYNSVDASLWFVIAADELRREALAAGTSLSDQDAQALRRSIRRILRGYADGTHHGIRADRDGLLSAGEPGVQLTWMDARVGTRVITPRIGKPVEVQALWLNALRIGAQFERRWARMFELGLESFRTKFWNSEAGCLHDVIDVDHVEGVNDPSIRPNQILAAGGLPFCLLTRENARQVVDRVEQQLLTPMGLRSLAPGHRDYAPRYSGGPEQRDSVYHQGTVWPWLMGPFVEAWVRARGDTQQARAHARSRFLAPMLWHLEEAGIGHISEVADAEPTHTPGGCPFQAWSLGEVLRLDQRVLAEIPASPAIGRRSPDPRPRRRNPSEMRALRADPLAGPA